MMVLIFPSNLNPTQLMESVFNSGKARILMKDHNTERIKKEENESKSRENLGEIERHEAKKEEAQIR